MIVFGCLLLFFAHVFGENLTINLLQGQILGRTLQSRDGRDFFAFQGIPYAEPPIGNLRFEDPKPAKPWYGVLLALTEPPICPQTPLSVLTGSEDCLYLNVYVPKVSSQMTKKLLPVMVWIHGGAFVFGHGGLSVYGPQYLMDEDVIFVSINYRLGSLGFLSTEDDVLPGNYGLKDQVLALKWVRDNIEKFGGDPNKVTLFGESAGGASVGLHLLSPLSKGLFHKAIIESGSTSCPWSVAPPGLAKKRTETLSSRAGCPKDPQEMVKCLKSLPVEVLVDLQQTFYEFLIHPIVIFTPVVEPCQPFKNSFLCEYPIEKFQQKSNVPVLMGMNSGEGALIAAGLYNYFGLTFPQIRFNFSKYISILALYKYSANWFDIPTIGKQIYNRYFPNIGDIDDPHKAVKLFSEGGFFHGIIDMALKTSPEAHFYVYDHVNEFSFSLIGGTYPGKLGSSHADELLSLFSISALPTLKGDDVKVSKLLVKIWTRFASKDELTIDGTDNGQTWPIFDKKELKFVKIQTSDVVISERPYTDAYEFWNELPIYPKRKQTKELL